MVSADKGGRRHSFIYRSKKVKQPFEVKKKKYLKCSELKKDMCIYVYMCVCVCVYACKNALNN